MSEPACRRAAARRLVKHCAPGRNRTCDTRFRKPMLYPLSYEGLRPISYLPGCSQECPGVPSNAHRCHLVARWASVAGRSASGANLVHTPLGVSGDDHECPTLTSGAIHSPSTFGALVATSELEKRLRRTTDVHAGSGDRSCTDTAGCASCGSVAERLGTRCPARGIPRSITCISEPLAPATGSRRSAAALPGPAGVGLSRRLSHRVLLSPTRDPAGTYRRRESSSRPSSRGARIRHSGS
jgi:hypothetical protein